MKKLLGFFSVLMLVAITPSTHAADELDNLLNALSGETTTTTTTETTTTTTDTSAAGEEDLSALFNQAEGTSTSEPDLDTLDSTTTETVETTTETTSTTTEDGIVLEPTTPSVDPLFENVATETVKSDETVVTVIGDQPKVKNTYLASKNGGKLTATGLNEVAIVILATLLATGVFYARKKRA